MSEVPKLLFSHGEIKQILADIGAIQDGHFALKNRGPDDDFREIEGCGDHSMTYVNKDKIYTKVRANRALGRQIALHFVDNLPQVVVGLAHGTIALASYVMDSLFDHGIGQKPPEAVYAEEEDGRKIFKRGFEALIPSKRILIVEDITTTGKSVQAVVEAVRLLHGEVIGVAVVCDRGGGNVTAKSLDVPRLVSLVTLTGEDVQKWPMEECPLCERNIPIDPTPGHGKDFLAIKGSLPILRK